MTLKKKKTIYSTYNFKNVRSLLNSWVIRDDHPLWLSGTWFVYQSSVRSGNCSFLCLQCLTVSGLVKFYLLNVYLVFSKSPGEPLCRFFGGLFLHNSLLSRTCQFTATSAPNSDLCYINLVWPLCSAWDLPLCSEVWETAFRMKPRTVVEFISFISLLSQVVLSYLLPKVWEHCSSIFV